MIIKESDVVGNETCVMLRSCLVTLAKGVHDIHFPRESTIVQSMDHIRGAYRILKDMGIKRDDSTGLPEDAYTIELTLRWLAGQWLDCEDLIIGGMERVQVEQLHSDSAVVLAIDPDRLSHYTAQQLGID